ncbi:hypothetical protein CP_0194 [Chlamydia pneumoniae AR39]|uniref:Uncharacterized protein n=1 Tax=Chlamydia pneumoniae TaxID=83558 RepID=Q9K2C4_CHLPN|nr:hypothetical protein CP_0194 [Chlamydia pneumoniae AR39]
MSLDIGISYRMFIFFFCHRVECFVNSYPQHLGLLSELR